MPRVICTRPNASLNISGVAFEPTEDGMAVISEEISDEQAENFLSIQGYAVAEEDADAAAAAAERAAAVATKAAAKAAAAKAKTKAPTAKAPAKPAVVEPAKDPADGPAATVETPPAQGAAGEDDTVF